MGTKKAGVAQKDRHNGATKSEYEIRYPYFLSSFFNILRTSFAVMST